MKYKLLNPPNPQYDTKTQILVNRGINFKEVGHYLNLTDADINDPECFGKELLMGAATEIYKAIKNEDDICVIVDADCDGYTSSAILINYLYDIAPKFTENHVQYFLHESKQHGLSDAMDWIEAIGPGLVIVPDAGSNDIEYIDKLHNDGIQVIILDHHIIEDNPSKNCYLINSQSPEYPNKELSGAGVVYQFCRFLDKQNNTDYADWYLDLVALGLDGDMMSLQSAETRRLITKGLDPARIHNPFIYEMWQKNKFKLGDNPTAWGATFYIVPLVNAITRSGTIEEKVLIFNSMLKFKAFTEILSNKRGHKLGEKEQLVTQAIRTCTNVKNRQTRSEEAGLELVEHLIKDNNMMDHKVLLFLLEPDAVKPEIRGLIANKLMAKYQRPCCMLTKTIDKISYVEYNPDAEHWDPNADLQGAWCKGDSELKEIEIVSYQGSARGCDMVGVTEFKSICAATHVCDYTIGHEGAFGLGLPADKVDEFLESTDEQLKDMASEPTYYVDYIWDQRSANAEAILAIADMDKFWGKDMPEALIAIEGIEVTKEMLTMMASNTLKITLPNGIPMIKFRVPDEEYDKLYSENGSVTINVVAKANKNEWNGNITAQLMIEKYEIVNQCAYVF